MRFYGSAMPFPHIQGAFHEILVADASQCVVANGLSAGEAAMAEPLSVCLHAAQRAGALKGQKSIGYRLGAHWRIVHISGTRCGGGRDRCDGFGR